MCGDEEGDDGGEGEWEDCDEDQSEDMENNSDDAEAAEAHGPTGDEDLDKLKDILAERGVQAVFPDLDGTALYTVLCKINHSCAPNVIVTYECTDGAIAATLTAARDIQPGEELLHSYIDQHMGKLLLVTASHTNTSEV
jgi:SET domain